MPLQWTNITIYAGHITQEQTQVQSLGQDDPLEEETATHSSILAWKSPWTEEPSGLQSMGCYELDATEQLSTHARHRMILTTVLHDGQLPECEMHNCRYRRTMYMEGRLQVILRFSTLQMVGGPGPQLFKSQLYTN